MKGSPTLCFLLLLFCGSIWASPCRGHSCLNGGYCLEIEDEAFCSCPIGFTGMQCEINHHRTLSSCVDFKCGDGTCSMVDGYPKCECPYYTNGTKCEFLLISSCLDFALCRKAGKNGICNPECNNPECLYDGGDCEGQAPDAIAAVFTLPPSEFLKEKANYMKMLSQKTNTALEISRNENGAEMVFEYDPEERKSYDLVGSDYARNNFSSVKVTFAAKDDANFDPMKVKNTVLDFAEAHHLPIPAALVQGPVRIGQPSPSTPIEYIIVGVVGVALVLVAMTILMDRRMKAKSPSLVWYPGPFEQKFAPGPEFTRGITDISALVAARLGLSTWEPLLSDMAASNDEESVRMRIKELSSLNARNPDGLTAIALAVDRGFAKFLRDLLNEGADPNIADNDGNTPLHRAVIAGSTVMVETLVSSGKLEMNAVNARNDSALMLYGKLVPDEQMGRVLVASGARVSFAGLNAMQNFHRKSALHFAAQAGNVAAICVFSAAKLEIGDKFEVNAPDIRLRTPLMLAAEYGSLEACQELIRLGADKELEDDMRKTAEMWARERGFSQVAEFLRTVTCNPQRKKRPSGESAAGATKRRVLEEINPNCLQQTNFQTFPPQMMNHYRSPEPNHYYSPYTPSPGAYDYVTSYQNQTLHSQHSYAYPGFAAPPPPATNSIPKPPDYHQNNAYSYNQLQYPYAGNNVKPPNFYETITPCAV